MAADWHFIFPLFRGPNWTPEACGSDLVVSDLECAVEYMKETYSVDNDKIFLVGGSGGGHASLLMAGRRPELFAAISSWCPISDLVAWFGETRDRKKDLSVSSYDDHIASACGGNPITSFEAKKEAVHRSPITWLQNARDKVILDIGTGIHDGHTGSVPVSHAINAYNKVALPCDRISDSDIDYIDENEAIPEHLKFEGVDEAYGDHIVLMRKTSGKVRLTLFEGGHNILTAASFGFLNNQSRGAEPVWNSNSTFDTSKKAEAEELSK
jgi:hypothetical protein